jgi:hypothetical protein
MARITTRAAALHPRRSWAFAGLESPARGFQELTESLPTFTLIVSVFDCPTNPNPGRK